MAYKFNSFPLWFWFLDWPGQIKKINISVFFQTGAWTHLRVMALDSRLRLWLIPDGPYLPYDHSPDNQKAIKIK